ncbi:uncharacterized protein V6R79_008970 [Siganus canaliculatus]
MASLTSRRTPPLVAFLLLMSFVPTSAEVVNSLSDCGHFLLHETPPQLPGILEDGKVLNQSRYKAICQTWRNRTRFVTLYDVDNKIPVFSAYRYRGAGDGGRLKTFWMIEPQLEEKNTNNMRNEQYVHQATSDDYSNSNYTKHQLFPVQRAFDDNDRMSTFSLTNTVPTVVSLNNGSFQKMERCIKSVLQRYCVNGSGEVEGFVVTGAQPSLNASLKQKVNVPSLLWSAFCCYSSSSSRWLAAAHWTDNTAEKPAPEDLQTKTLDELRLKLSSDKEQFDVFPNSQCPLNTTVAEFYPEVNDGQEDPPCPQQELSSVRRRTTVRVSRVTWCVSEAVDAVRQHHINLSFISS